MYKKIFSISLITLLTACHSTSDTAANKTTVAKTSSKNMTCEHTASTGSHLKKKRCMSKELAEAVREVNKENMRSLKKAQSIGQKNKL